MLDKLKQEAMRRGMKLLSNPKVAQMMADPRLLTAISKGLEVKGTVQREVGATVKAMASALSLATRSDLDDVAQQVKRDLRRDLRDLEVRCGDLERRVQDEDEQDPQ